MSKREDRLAKLTTLLADHEPRRISDLAKMFGVCEMTIRRDASLLEREGRLKLLHGAIVWGSGRAREQHRPDRASDASRSTEAGNIAARAASVLEPSDTVMMDGAPLSEAVAWAFPESTTATFITYSQQVFSALSRLSSARIILAGGEYDPETSLFRGTETTSFLRSIRATKAFISAGGISLDLGVTCSNAYEYELKRSLMECSICPLLLAGSESIDHTESTFFASLADFEVVVCDAPLPVEYVAFCRRHGIRVMQSGEDAEADGSIPAPTPFSQEQNLLGKIRLP